MNKIQTNKGFTLIEILVVIGIIAILAAIVIIAINPARQFAQARNSQRTSNVNAILNAIGQNIADNKGVFTCENDGDSANDSLPSDEDDIKSSGAAADIFNLRPCIVPTFIPEIPVDPTADAIDCDDADDYKCEDSGESYDTLYTVKEDATTHRITVCAPKSVETALNMTSADEICVTR